MLLENLADGFEILVQEILRLVEAHPLGKQSAAAADDSGDAVAHERQKLAQHAGVDGHVVHALLGLLFDHFEHDVQIQIFGAADAGERFVNGDGADGHGRGFNDGFADHGDVAAGGKVHHGVRAVVHGAMQFFELFADVRGGGGISDVGVDFAEECDADAHGLEIAVVDVGGDDSAAAGDFAAHEFGLEFLARGDVFHLFGDEAEAGEVHLREVSHAAVHRRRTLLNPLISQSHSNPQ